MMLLLSRKLSLIINSLSLLILISLFSPSLSLSATSKPILLISSASNPISSYYGEILTTEGFNSFDERDIANLSTDLLSSYDVVLLGKTALTNSQVDILTAWVNGGGSLIAMRPDSKLADLLGLAGLGVTTSNAYLRINTSSGAGEGITGEIIQYHGTADLYNLQGASSIATLYTNASTATSNPAVTLRSVGNNGGSAAAFTYDLAASVVQTRQGNPAWSGQERDGYQPIRSDDLFYGNANFDPRPDWIDLDKVAIPQADEQQRLLANLIIRMNMNKKPLPRFWYFPRSLPAVVVMTGDDHGNWNGTGGTAGRFDQYISLSAPGCSVDNWECIRGTSYVYPDLALTNTQASFYNNAGFEVALHLNTDCADWTRATLTSFLDTQLAQWQSKYPALPAPVTNRTHCIVWSDYATQPEVEHNFGIRLDTNYYYWPPGWVANTPGFFTGSGIPMRFTDAGGNLIDVYQATTQMTDESGQSYPFTIDTLLNRATGPEGYYGAFVANIHTDVAVLAASDAIVNSAKARDIPVITARQLLKWLDGRNSSAYGDLTWNGSTLGFSIYRGEGANGLTVMAPVVDGKSVTRVNNNGNSITFSTKTIKGVKYVTFQAISGTCEIIYSSGSDSVSPTVTLESPQAGSTVSGTIAVTANASDNIGIARVEFYLDEALQTTDTTAPYEWAWNSLQATNGTHSLSAKAYDAAGNAGTSSQVTVTVSNGTATGIALVQKVSNTTSSARTLAVTMPAQVTAGNLLVVSVSGWPNLPAATAVTDSLGNSYAPAGTIQISQGAYSAVYYAKNIKGGANTVTFTTVDSDGQISMAAAEFSGVDTVSPLDKTAGATGSGNAPSSGAMTPTAANSLIVGSGSHNGSTVTTTGSGFTIIAIPTEDSNTHQPLAMEYRVLSGTDPVAATFNLATAYPWMQNGAIFRPSGGSPVIDTTPPTVTAFTIPATSSSLTVSISSFTATDNVAVSGYLLSESTTAPSATASEWTTSAPTSYTFATAGSKTLYAWAKDSAGNVSASRSASVVITVVVSDSYSIWSSTTVPGIVDVGPDNPVELGVKFKSDLSGSITGIRFYKASANTGTHVANLWSSSGTRLATATFSGESASGWQQVNFATPVAITANTVYVASYHTNTGHYSFNLNFFNNRSVDNPPLHAIADGVSGGNGVFAYGFSSAFPNQSWNASNYWVDLVFAP